MASLQARRVRGHTYWHIVESRRVNGKPRPVPVAYLGKADDLLKRLTAVEHLQLRSFAHGDVAALWHQAQQLDLAALIDRELLASGRRLGGSEFSTAKPRGRHHHAGRVGRGRPHAPHQPAFLGSNGPAPGGVHRTD